MNRRPAELRGLNQLFEGRGYSVVSVGHRPEEMVSDLLTGSKELSAEQYSQLAAELDLGNRSIEEIEAIMRMCDDRMRAGIIAQRHVGFHSQRGDRPSISPTRRSYERARRRN